MNVFRKEYRELSAGEKMEMDDTKDIAQKLYEVFERATTPNNGREMALAKTKLEEAVMWAVKGITG